MTTGQDSGIMSLCLLHRCEKCQGETTQRTVSWVSLMVSEHSLIWGPDEAKPHGDGSVWRLFIS